MAQLLYAVAFIIVARSEGPSALGAVAVAVAVATVSAGLLDFGSNSLWVRELAAGTQEHIVISRRANGKLTASVIAGLVLTAVGVEWGGPHVALGAMTVGLVLGQLLQVPLRAARRGDLVAVSIVADKAIMSSIVGVSAAFGARTDAALVVGVVFGGVTSALVSRALTARPSRLRLRSRPALPWSGSVHFGIASGLITLQALDLPLLSFAGGSTAAGTYGAVNRWTQPMNMIVTTFSSTSAPYFAEAGTISRSLSIVWRTAWFPALATVGSVVVALAAPLIVPILLGPQFADSVAVLQVLALGTIPVVINQPLFVILQATRHDRAVARVLSVCIVLQLSLTVLLGREFGAMGAAIAYVAFQTALAAALLTLILVFLKRPRPHAEEDVAGFGADVAT